MEIDFFKIFFVHFCNFVIVSVLSFIVGESFKMPPVYAFVSTWHFLWVSWLLHAYSLYITKKRSLTLYFFQSSVDSNESKPLGGGGFRFRHLFHLYKLVSNLYMEIESYIKGLTKKPYFLCNHKGIFQRADWKNNYR